MTHHHGHAHGHDHGHSTKLTGLTALLAVYMVAEIVGGWWSGSLALLADAGHMAIDVLAMLLGLFAVWMAKRPANDAKTFGYYRAEILAALVNGALLVAVASWLLIEAVQRINHPREIHAEWMGAIALGGLAVNLIGLYLLGKQSRENLNLRGIWLHLLADTLGSVGSVAAAVAIYFFGWNQADPIISLMISSLIFIGSWKLLKESVNVLLEGVPRGIEVGHVRRTMASYSGVQGVHDLHIWTMTSGVHSLSAHINVVAGADHAIILKGLSELLEREFGLDHVTLQLEPPTFLHEHGHVHT